MLQIIWVFSIYKAHIIHTSNDTTSISYTFIHKCFKKPNTFLSYFLLIVETFIPIIHTSFSSTIDCPYHNQTSNPYFHNTFHNSDLLILTYNVSKSINIQYAISLSCNSYLLKSKRNLELAHTLNDILCFPHVAHYHLFYTFNHNTVKHLPRHS